VDDQGDVLLELVKEAWRESGTWHEGSEAGTYDESDQYLSWTARLGQAEKLHVEVAILDMGDATADEPGTVLDSFPPHDPQKPPDVPVTVIVRRRTVDGTLFLLAVLLSGGLAILAYYRSGHGGIPVVVEQRAEGVVHAPLAWMGGSWRLVTVAVSGAYDEHGPESVEMNVRFKDASGREIHHASQGTSTWYLSADHGHRRFWIHLHFELPRGQYQVTVRAHPHQGMDSMKVIIRDGNTTRGEVDVTRIPKEAA